MGPLIMPSEDSDEPVDRERAFEGSGASTRPGHPTIGLVVLDALQRASAHVARLFERLGRAAILRRR
jgi:hypothetical protein